MMAFMIMALTFPRLAIVKHFQVSDPTLLPLLIYHRRMV